MAGSAHLTQTPPTTTIYERRFNSGLEGKYSSVYNELPTNSRVLDVGGSSGYFSSFMMSQGHKVTLLDGDPHAIRLAHERGIEAYAADLNAGDCLSALSGRRFDAILFMDVLEHLIDPSALLRNAQRLLEPDGKIIVTGPNAAYWAVRLNLLIGNWDYTDTGIMDRTHLRWFTFGTWQHLITSSGYAVQSSTACEGMIPKEQWLQRLGFSSSAVTRLRCRMLKSRPQMWGIVFLFVATLPKRPSAT